MNIAYFDCFSGAGGDMILGSLIDAGLDLKQLNNELSKLHLTHYDIEIKRVVRKGIGGIQAIVNVDQNHHGHHHRHLHHIEEIIAESGLEESVKQKSIGIFRRLAEAEAKVHQTTIEHVHFHEVGATDAIIDVVGAVAGLAALGVEKIYCSPLHLGTGTVETAHGTLPVPAPATLELVKGVPVYSTGVRGELLTPTAAAVLTTLSSGFGTMPPMIVEKTGYGAGTSDPAIPNLVRVILGKTLYDVKGYETEQIAVIETSIDDMNPQFYDYLIQKILDMGAMDVFLIPLQMKKTRPGTMITVICYPDMIGKISDFIIKETTSIGLRWRVDNRIKAHRTIKELETRYGTVRFKIAQVGEDIVNISPEYEDCRRAALKKNIPLIEVVEEARLAAMNADFHKK